MKLLFKLTFVSQALFEGDIILLSHWVLIEEGEGGGRRKIVLSNCHCWVGKERTEKMSETTCACQSRTILLFFRLGGNVIYPEHDGRRVTLTLHHLLTGPECKLDGKRDVPHT